MSLRPIFYFVVVLISLSACGVPGSIGVGEWDGKTHTIEAKISQGTGIADVHYLVSIDGNPVIDKNVPRSQHRLERGSVLVDASGTFENHTIDATFKQTAKYGTTYFSHQIRVDGDLVAVITP